MVLYLRGLLGIQKQKSETESATVKFFQSLTSNQLSLKVPVGFLKLSKNPLPLVNREAFNTVLNNSNL